MVGWFLVILEPYPRALRDEFFKEVLCLFGISLFSYFRGIDIQKANTGGFLFAWFRNPNGIAIDDMIDVCHLGIIAGVVCVLGVIVQQLVAAVNETRHNNEADARCRFPASGFSE